MKIGIFGNSGSGKTSLANHFNKNGFHHSIDVNNKNVLFINLLESNLNKVYPQLKHTCLISETKHQTKLKDKDFDFILIGQLSETCLNQFEYSITKIVREQNLKKGQFCLIKRTDYGDFNFVENIQVH